MSQNKKTARENRGGITRRRFLRGVGVTMALPWLESLPAWGADTAPSRDAAGEATAALPKRFAVMFMGCGVNPNHWWAKGSGADMQLGRTLEPLESVKTKINVINGL